MHVPEWNCTKIADGNGGMQMNGIGSLNALSPHSDCFAIKFVTRILCHGFEGSQKQAVELQEFEGAASETRPSAFEFRRMETRIAVEEPTMPFPSHVSAPFMLGDELFMPDSVAPMAQAAYLMAEEGSVMTANQLETLRRQISVYATICQQLVEMHKASMSYRPALSGVLLPGQAMPFDSLVGTHKAPSRQRWAPSHSQLQILEKIFDQINGTPNKQKIKEITAELSQYGQITETNVYNWFQNRKARAKRKHQSTTQKDGDSGGDTDGDSIDKKVRVDTSPDNCSGHNSGGSSGVHAYDQDQTSCFRSDTYVNSSSGLQGMASGHYKGLGGKNLGGKA